MALICADGRENTRGGPQDCRPAEQIQLTGLKGTEHSPGGARAGHASLMRPAYVRSPGCRSWGCRYAIVQTSAMAVSGGTDPVASL